ncbi:hypothetical protein CJ030_MR7G021965 [Morella rubra]|uniref:Uncharacterized protein n=1 Tax=Morella rubra TaxID=262757 RepID=A0A6A1UZY5_9ROSI|nr:hypothetical protein CJ030_MR7G021965 [Morella rubra]
MSMFSPFDALCAESKGHKMSLWTSSNKEPKPTPKPVEKEGTSTTTNVSKPQQPLQKQRRPRFAPEIDGIHFFETILPY